jgi:hypothetical protein
VAACSRLECRQERKKLHPKGLLKLNPQGELQSRDGTLPGCDDKLKNHYPEDGRRLQIFHRQVQQEKQYSSPMLGELDL